MPRTSLYPMSNKLHLLQAKIDALADGRPCSIMMLGASQEADNGSQWTLTHAIRQCWRLPNLPDGSPGYVSTGGRAASVGGGTAKAISCAHNTNANFFGALAGAEVPITMLSTLPGTLDTHGPTACQYQVFAAKAITGGQHFYCAYVQAPEYYANGFCPWANRQSHCRLVYWRSAAAPARVYATGLRTANSSLGAPAATDTTLTTWAGGRDATTPVAVNMSGADGLVGLDVDCGSGDANADMTLGPGVRLSAYKADATFTGTLQIFGTRVFASAGGSPIDGFGVFDIGSGGWTTAEHAALHGTTCTEQSYRDYCALMGGMDSIGGPNVVAMCLGQNMTAGQSAQILDASASLAAGYYAQYQADIRAEIEAQNAMGLALNGEVPLVLLTNPFSTAGSIGSPTSIDMAIERDQVICQRRGLALYGLSVEYPNVLFWDGWQSMPYSATSQRKRTSGSSGSFTNLFGKWTNDDIHESPHEIGPWVRAMSLYHMLNASSAYSGVTGLGGSGGGRLTIGL